MTTARELMTEGAQCIKENESLIDAARRMKELDVGALPICGENERLVGMLTDRDIVVKCLAEGGDPRQMTARELAEGTPVTISADAEIEEALALMEENQIRRLPVIENRRLVGILAQADVARALPNERVGAFVESVSVYAMAA
jgi:CBS domain-containing protein